LEQLDLQEEEHQEYEEEAEETRDPKESEIRLQGTSNEEDYGICRGRRRPKLLKTGQPGKSKKIY